MKLLLDEQLSRRIVPFLQAAYPGSTQVALIGMERASDREIWEYARANGFAIVTKDSDFYDLSLVLGAPPQVV
jgi:predicted nuclease of predicted toxin-antitoxin system